MCVRHEVRADAGGVEIPPEIGQVVGTGVVWDDVRKAEPLAHMVDRFRGDEPGGRAPWGGSSPYKSGRYDPRNTDSLRAVN